MIKKLLGERFSQRWNRRLGVLTNTHLKIRKLSAWCSEDLRTVAILKSLEVKTVIDVGANTGQFAEALFDYNYTGKVISFEPTKHAHDILRKKAKKTKNWEVAERCALGNYVGNTKINVATNSVFSSLKKISEQYKSGNSEAEISHTEEVAIYTLDSLVGKSFRIEEDLFLKIDTQGFEKEVLEGADLVLQQVKGVKIEAPLKPIYDNVDFSLREMLNYFHQKGFRCLSISEVGVNKKTGEVYEVDLILINERFASEHHG